jgi:FMN-dependent NADH-azoreductase
VISSSPLETSVVVGRLFSENVKRIAKNVGSTMTARLKLHSKRVEKTENHTRNEWRRRKITLETSGELSQKATAEMNSKFLTELAAADEALINKVSELLHSF